MLGGFSLNGNKEQDEEGEYLFVSFAQLGYEIRDNPLSFKLQYQIIQRLKAIRGEKTVENIRTGKEQYDIPKDGELPNLEQNEKALIKKYIEKYRPENGWKKIAKMLGIHRQTLKRKRKKYDLM